MAVITKEFIFIHVPKTGGRSMLAGLLPLLDVKYNPPSVPKWFAAYHSGNMHKRMGSDKAVLGAIKRSPSIFVFGFVRHPYDWVVALWHWKRAGRPMLQYLEEDFAKETPHGAWNWPQSSWLECKEKKANFIGQLESFDKDFAKLGKRLGFKSTPIHYGGADVKSRTPICEESKKFIDEAHGADIERFGYTFNLEE